MFAHFEKLYINGEWVSPSSRESIGVEDPALLETFARVPDADENDTDDAVRAAAAARESWAQVPVAERIALMEKMLGIFRTMEDEITALDVRELGAPVTYTRYKHCRYQFGRVASFIEAMKELSWRKNLTESEIWREPMGVVACITPWNYPLGQIIQKVVPALLTGNTVVIKPSSIAPLTAFLLVDAFDRAGFPAGTVNLITGRGEKIGKSLAEHPLVDMISFTGSTSVGRDLSRLAAGSIKRLSLELGGKSPYIWLKGADWSQAVPKLVSSVFANAGQTCTSLSRLIVPEDSLWQVEELVKDAVAKLNVGSPALDATDIGPVSSRAQFDCVKSYIAAGIKGGARLIAGGIPVDPVPGTGYLIAPTVFSDVTNDMVIAREEIFGPVLSILTYRTVDEAVAIANDTIYGLSAGVCGPTAEALAVARRIRAGNVFINDAARDLMAPLGGYGQSGHGREGGLAGLEEFTQTKSVFVRH